jgi:predicted MFS family arabinose efflux permease
VAIFIGAAIGAALLFRFGVAAPLVLAGALVLFGTIGCAIYPPKSRATAG